MYGTASALDYAHALTGPDGQPVGLVHRDVSANNVLVSFEGAVKLIDFGIARAASRRHHTQVGTLKGKIPYMSPEQVRGEPLDRRSDLFSLGVVVYELTTGRRPFLGDTDFVIMEQIVHGTAQPPSRLVRGYPPELEAMVMRLLARRADERYQTAEELLHDLDPYIAQHRLYAPAKTMSKYMRTIFSAQLAGFEDPNLDEVTRAQRIIATITMESQTSQLTPPSSLSAVLPVSQEMAAVRPSAALLEAAVTSPLAALSESPAEPGVEAVPAVPAVADASAPVSAAVVAPPRRRRRGAMFALLAIAAVGLGGLLAFLLRNRPAETRPTTSEAQPAAVETRPTTPAPADPAPREATARVTEVEEVAPTGAETPPVEDRKPTATGAGSGTTAAKAGAVTKKPAAKPVPVAPSRKPPAARTPGAKDTTPKEPKDPAWDKNDNDSPFLPN
jgi:hypothetical protein